MSVKIKSERAFTLIELVTIIVVIGIIAAVATRKMSATLDTARYEATKTELDNLAMAVVGDPDSYGEGARAVFGYVGDVGGLPPNLDALATNPGGYTTWHGPYIDKGNGSDFKKDAWGTTYSYAGTTISSTGSGSSIDKVFASASSKLLQNTLQGSVIDANGSLPGSVYKDSLRINLIYPNGSGGTTTATVYPNVKGEFSIANLPMGNRQMQMIYLPKTDTITIPVTIYPGRTATIAAIWPADLW